jgi:hypothetical protein
MMPPTPNLFRVDNKMPKRWETKDIAYLRAKAGDMKTREIAKRMGRSISSVRSKLKALKLTFRRRWSEQDLEILREQYPHKRTEDIARILGCPIYSVYNKAYDLGIRKSPEFKASEQSGVLTKHNAFQRGGAYRFKKGQVPMNKGLRRPGWSPGRMKDTQFKKGQMPFNHQPVGTIVVVDGYKKIKLAEPKTWEHFHRHVWMQSNGPIPRGRVVVFKNGDPMNCDIENLECISRKELMQRNTLHNYPEPVRSAIHQLAGFNRRLNRYAKKQNAGLEKHAVRDNGAASG